MTRIAIVTLLGVLVLPACGDGGSGGDLPAETAVRIVAGDREWIVPVEIAATPRTRERGLMGRASLPPDRGMLFLYPEPDVRRFWMKNCLLPIDAAYVDGEGRIVNVVEMVPEPGVEFPRTYPSARPVRSGFTTGSVTPSCR